MERPMSHNPYAPPTAHVEDLDTTRELVGQVAYFPVSPLKLVVLSAATLNLYLVYWFYKNWTLIKARERSSILPIMRAIFSVFYCYSCYRRISEEGVSNGLRRVHAGPLATIWIVLTLTSRFPDPYGLLALTAPLAMIPVQRYVNRLNAIVAPVHDHNDRFTTWNWLGILVGGLFLLLVLVGVFLPEEYVE
jgi:hypothetical protein